MEAAEFRTIGRDAINEPRFQNSPIRALFEGADGVRQRFDIPMSAEAREFGIYADLRAEGITDYMALPMVFTDGKRHACSWGTRQPGGFTTEHLMVINDLLPVLQMAIEIRVNRRIARTLLETYVGKFAGDRILSGDITRGSGTTVRAAIWTCDMRGFTAISEMWPRDEVIGSLNDYFDTMAVPVENHGGEILKFIGDAMLAIFPLENAAACNHAMLAAFEAREGMRALNDRRRHARPGRDRLRHRPACGRRDVRQHRRRVAPRLHRHRPGGQCRSTPRIAEQGPASTRAAVRAVRLPVRLQRRVSGKPRPPSAARCRRRARGVRARR